MDLRGTIVDCSNDHAATGPSVSSVFDRPPSGMRLTRLGLADGLGGICLAMEVCGLFLFLGLRHIKVFSKETALALGTAGKAQAGAGPGPPDAAFVRHAEGF